MGFDEIGDEDDSTELWQTAVEVTMTAEQKASEDDKSHLEDGNEDGNTSYRKRPWRPRRQRSRSLLG